jgi:hypothetical protein
LIYARYHWFSNDVNSEKIFIRNAVASWSITRQKMFQIFHQIGLATPIFGRVRYIRKQHPEIKRVVVYTDELAHCGEGKILIDTKAIPEAYDHLYCSEFIECSYGCSYRLLSIGGITHWFKHASVDDWRSNHGDGDLFPVEPDLILPICNKIKNPVWAIDFVLDENKNLLAIDLNPAPKGQGTGIEKLLPAKQAYLNIEKILEDIAIPSFNNNLIKLLE